MPEEHCEPVVIEALTSQGLIDRLGSWCWKIDVCQSSHVMLCSAAPFFFGLRLSVTGRHDRLYLIVQNGVRAWILSAQGLIFQASGLAAGDILLLSSHAIDPMNLVDSRCHQRCWQ